MKDQNNHFHWVYDTILKYNVEMSSQQLWSIIAFPGSWGDDSVDQMLAYQHKDWSLDPQCHVNSQWVWKHTCMSSAQEEETKDPWNKLACQTSQIVEFQG